MNSVNLPSTPRSFGVSTPGQRASNSVAKCANKRGSVLQAQGDLEGALRCYEEAERIDRTAFGKDHPDVARDLNNCGSVLQAQGDLEGALRCYEEAERIDRKAFGDDHPDVARDVNNRGSVLLSNGDFKGARACGKEAFSICLRKLGPRANDTLTGAGNLAAVRIDPVVIARELVEPEVAREFERFFAEWLMQQL
jgi:tetratricopeptide (TPR) repeat protein